ncbi:GuaB3 family IMP dehydrogenase-related protein [Corynebacterium faecium]|uniref:GuaB3 family IMP dehydrogenase-related protein n=1 Tax=Corynebacterium faecium TaxID=3016001 RepID=UPI0022B2BC8C|nr:GuaB3 family IMP dehydrogenase-related protein [Corynebacterium faecium]
MRDYVEIGLGREARRAYDLGDLSIVPKRRTRSSKDVDTSWHIDAYAFDIPLVSHPTDALASPEFIIEMGKQGGLGVIDAEGLWGRHADFEAAVKKVVESCEDAWGIDSEEKYQEYLDSGERSVRTLQELHAAELDRDLLTERIAQVRDSGVTVAVRVSPQNARELAPVVIAAGAEILFIQGSIVSAEHVQQGGEPLNLKEFVGSLDVPVIAGGVFDYSTATHLMRSGVAGVIVGSGSSSTVVKVPAATAIADVAAARRDYLDETGGRYVHVLADVPIWDAESIALAIACGADAVMLGRTLEQASEAAANGVYWEAQAAHPRFPRGDVSKDPIASTSTALETVLFGPSSDPYGGLNIVGGLKRIMAKCGYTDVKAFQKADLAIRS